MLRKTVSLTLAWMFLVSTISGIMLYIAPPGRIAHWADWSLLWLSKSEWGNIHTVTTILMLIVVGLHLYYNWKPFISYMKSKVTKLYTLTRELAISLVITLAVAVGAAYQVPPFSYIINLGDYISEEWEVKYGTPPYNHAELDSVEKFCKKLKVDYVQATAKLKENNIVFDESETLGEIASNHKISPQAIYNLVVDKNTKLTTAKGSNTGMGKKTLIQVCELKGLDFESAMKKLESKNISFSKNDKFKDIAENNDMSPMDLLKIIK